MNDELRITFQLIMGADSEHFEQNGMESQMTLNGQFKWNRMGISNELKCEFQTR